MSTFFRRISRDSHLLSKYAGDANALQTGGVPRLAKRGRTARRHPQGVRARTQSRVVAMTGPRLSPPELVAAIRSSRPHTPHQLSSQVDREPDGEPQMDELDDDVREHDGNYTREYGAMLTRGGW